MRTDIHGSLTIVEKLAQKLLCRWVPKWYEAFYDHERGGFYERAGPQFKPLRTGQRRLLTQCRQLAAYSHAAACGGPFKPGADLDACFEFILGHYHNPETGGFIFSLDDDGRPSDTSYDLYALGFVIFAFSHYYRLRGDGRAKDRARQVLDFINAHFRVPEQPGLAEALDKDLQPLPRLRRHESHMHFLEACLFAFEVWGDPAFGDMAAEMIALFETYFYDGRKRMLSEYYDEALNPAPDESGHIITEPGHYCEWIWLLKKHAVQSGVPDRYDALCRDLLDWANHYGWDGEYGGIYDELDDDGQVVTDTKRLWPFTEALKANALMLDSGVDKITVKTRIAEMVRVFGRSYMQERGFWTEWLARDLTPATDYMPGTTPYHVYFGIMESREALAARGRTKSLRTGPAMALYRLRRGLSHKVRAVRKGLRKDGTVG